MKFTPVKVGVTMFKYFQTTALILGWSFLFSIIWSYFIYSVTHRQKRLPLLGQSQLGGAMVLLPVLVLGPVAVVSFYTLFHINLLFPVHFFASSSRLLVAAIVPALVLVLACGLLGNLARTISNEYAIWSRKPFCLVLRAFGKSVPTSLKKLVLAKSLAKAWSQSLPWLFGELIVLEAVFNAPGLGYDAWQMARMRDFQGLVIVMGALIFLYGVCVFLSAVVHRWIGKRLEGYS